MHDGNPKAKGLWLINQSILGSNLCIPIDISYFRFEATRVSEYFFWWKHGIDKGIKQFLYKTKLIPTYLRFFCLFYEVWNDGSTKKMAKLFRGNTFSHLRALLGTERISIQSWYRIWVDCLDKCCSNYNVKRFVINLKK